MTKQLKIKANDYDSLPLMAALIQDAVFIKSDLYFDAAAHRFIMVGNRFCWEAKRPWWQRGLFAKKHPGNRIRTVLHINGVLSVATQGFDSLAADTVLALLDMQLTPDQDGLGGQLTLVFAGETSLRLTLECVELFLSDHGEPFPAIARPDHEKNVSNDDDGFN